MNRSVARVAIIGGASTLALSLVAGPALAAQPDLVPPAHAASSHSGVLVTPLAVGVPSAKIAARHLTLKSFVTKGKGVTAVFKGFPANDSIVVSLSDSESGGLLPGDFKSDAAGALTVHYSLTGVDPATVPFGTYKLAAFSGEDASITAAAAFVVKDGSVLTWKPALRTSGHVKLTAAARKWSVAGRKYVGWKNATVEFQVKTATGWKTKKTVHTNAKGVATVTLTAGKHTWRAALVGTKSVWGHVSGAHRK